MKLVIWNCKQGLHRKAQQLLELSPDIAIVPTAARQARTVVSKASSSAWVGETANKGLGIYAFGDSRVSLHPAHDNRLQWIAPILVEGPLPFFLLAVWAQNRAATQNHADQRKRGPIQPALEAYRPAIEASGLPVVVAGDFESCPAWDKRERQTRHADQLKALGALGLESAYHAVRNAAHGEEPEPTVYDKGDAGEGVHTTFCFIPKAWTDRAIQVTVGDVSPWVEEGWSDHVPLSVNIPAA